MNLFSVKMRAAKNAKHISGAEKIITKSDLHSTIANLTTRALEHDLGTADFINLKIEALPAQDIRYLPALPVSSHMCTSMTESFAVMEQKLQELGINDAQPLIRLLQNCHNMRGAVLYDIHTKKRTEPDQNRGVRVTYMDSCFNTTGLAHKNHFCEALVLATKVAHAPGMLAEICISDDHDYTTGYLASLQHGYVRLNPLKNKGSAYGGRIFIFDSRIASAAKVIRYLEEEKVLVTGMDSSCFTRTSITDFAAAELSKIKQQQLYRSMTTISTPQSKNIQIDSAKKLLFSSNDYLNLANNAEVKQAAATAALTWGAGTGGSRLTTGTNELHVQLERKLAAFKGTEAALLFNTGYTANLGVLSCLADAETVIFSDEYNHASIIDGCRLSKAKIVVYKHNDMQDLEQKIQTTACSKGIIVSDSVFSMDGDIVNLPQLTALGKKYNLFTIIDEAHATGVIGSSGKGAVQHYNYTCAPDLIIGTLSKALGSEGGFACGSKVIIDYLVNKARSFIFSTSQNPASLGAALKSLEILTASAAPVAALQDNVRYFQQSLQRKGISVTAETAIIPLIIGSEKTALQIAQELYEAGFLISAIRYPTVAKNTARLRIALMSTHTHDELDRLAEAIYQALLKHHLLS